ncbi:MAG TPA: OsmC family protein [Vicinamibacterales bacterium]|nr:OsmC family protein [Vicinamibacterales bacterium]
MAAKPPAVVELTWIGDLKFAGTSGSVAITLDSAGVAGPSPVQTLALAFAGCMAMDVAHILTRGRYVFEALRARLVADRAPDEPHRIVRMTLHFVVRGEVPHAAVDHAIALSREKYCSVWHSMRQDIELTVTAET